jgi:hypothetical protein
VADLLLGWYTVLALEVLVAASERVGVEPGRVSRRHCLEPGLQHVGIGEEVDEVEAAPEREIEPADRAVGAIHGPDQVEPPRHHEGATAQQPDGLASVLHQLE